MSRKGAKDSALSGEARSLDSIHFAFHNNNLPFPQNLPTPDRNLLLPVHSHAYNPTGFSLPRRNQVPGLGLGLSLAFAPDPPL